MLSFAPGKRRAVSTACVEDSVNDAGRGLDGYKRRRLRTRAQPRRRIKLPCWPNASKMTIFLTLGITRFIFRYSFILIPLIFFPMFLFAHEIDRALDLVGYDSQFVSEFPFIRGWYLRMTEFPATRNVELAYFHVLDLAMSLTIAVWASWLVTGIVFLKQYDHFFQIMGGRLLAPHPVQLSLSFITALALPFILYYGTGSSKIMHDIAWCITELPILFFTFVAFAYFVYGYIATFGVLFILWKIFRGMWPGAVLWSEETAERGYAR